jgi:hypothetical protein
LKEVYVLTNHLLTPAQFEAPSSSDVPDYDHVFPAIDKTIIKYQVLNQ